MKEHALRISFPKKMERQADLLTCKNFRISKKLFTKLFGHNEQVAVVFPGNEVANIEIVTSQEGGGNVYAGK